MVSCTQEIWLSSYPRQDLRAHPNRGQTANVPRRKKHAHQSAQESNHPSVRRNRSKIVDYFSNKDSANCSFHDLLTGRSVTLLDSRTKKEVAELDSIADLVPIDALTESTSKLGPVVELKEGDFLTFLQSDQYLLLSWTDYHQKKLDWGIPSEPSAACRPVRAARVFHRNVRECISAAESGTHPAKRPRHSAEEGPSEKRPRVEHFVQVSPRISVLVEDLPQLAGLANRQSTYSLSDGNRGLPSFLNAGVPRVVNPSYSWWYSFSIMIQ